LLPLLCGEDDGDPDHDRAEDDLNPSLWPFARHHGQTEKDEESAERQEREEAIAAAGSVGFQRGPERSAADARSRGKRRTGEPILSAEEKALAAPPNEFALRACAEIHIGLGRTGAAISRHSEADCPESQFLLDVKRHFAPVRITPQGPSPALIVVNTRPEDASMTETSFDKPFAVYSFLPSAVIPIPQGR